MLREKGFFEEQARKIHHLHRSQTLDDVKKLNDKYQNPVFGEVRISDLIQRLNQVVDPTDKELDKVTQWGHCIQVISMMEKEGVKSEEFLVAGFVHDIGKVLLLAKENPENVVCDNFPIGQYSEKIGLDNVVFQWNHDEFGYMKLKNHLPDHMAKLIRYHSINPSVYKLLSDKDKWLQNNYLIPFRKYDKMSKSTTKLPVIDEDRYLKLLDKWFPKPILI